MQTKLGEIRYADAEFEIRGDKQHLERILNEPIWTPNGKKITKDNPKKFMENLRFNYKSVYFKAMRSVLMLMLLAVASIASAQVPVQPRSGKFVDRLM